MQRPPCTWWFCALEAVKGLQGSQKLFTAVKEEGRKVKPQPKHTKQSAEELLFQGHFTIPVQRQHMRGIIAQESS